MKWLHYVRFLTYGAGAACIALLWNPDDRYFPVRLSHAYPMDYLMPVQAGSWRDEWFDGADVYRAAQLRPRDVMDLAERELTTTDWKAFQPTLPRIASVTLSSYKSGLVWGVEWIDTDGYRFHISVNDATREVRHNPKVEKSLEKDWPLPSKKAAEPGATDNPDEAQRI